MLALSFFFLVIVQLISFGSISVTAQQCSSSSPCPGNLCCSQWGWCGSTNQHCAPSYKCISNCWPNESGPGSTSSSSSSTKTSTSAAPSPTLSNPCGNGVVGVCADGTCCSEWGWCGTSSAHCAPVNNCRSNCWPNNTGPGTTTSSSSSSSSASTASSSASSSSGTTTRSTTTQSTTTTTTTTTTTVPPGAVCGNGVIGSCPSGQCCSQYGWCGTGADWCAPMNNCKFNCWPNNTGPGSTTTTTTSSSTTTSSASSSQTSATTTTSSGSSVTVPPVPPTTSISDSIENPWSDPRGVYSSCRQKGTIALTFDDGPSSFTPQLLDYLKQYNLKVTFFVVGSMFDSDPVSSATLLRAYQEGHMIASHTFTHADLTTLSDSQIISELQKNSDAIYRVIGVRPRYMRPPYGAIDERVTALLTTKLGYRVILWNFDTLDWSDQNTNTLITKMSQQLSQYSSQSSQKSFNVLMHDIEQTTVSAMPRLIPLVQSSVFRPVRMDECLLDAYPYF